MRAQDALSQATFAWVRVRGQRMSVMLASGDTAQAHVLWRIRFSGVSPRYFAAVTGGPEWSRDGTRLLFPNPGDGWLVASRDGRVIRVRCDWSGTATWSPDGRRVACSSEGERIEIHTVMTGESREVLVDEGAGDTSKDEPAWSPDGRDLAVVETNGSGSQSLSLYSLARRSLRRTEIGGTSPAWSPSGEWLVTCSQCDADLNRVVAPTISVSRLARGAERRVASRAYQPGWSPDGREIVFARPLGSRTELWVTRATGGEERRLTSGPWHDAAPSWRPR